MLYEHYERRVIRNLSILKFLQKHKFKLLAILAVVFLALSLFSVTKGNIYDVNIPETFTFGEDINISSKALFSKVTYLYQLDGSDTWTDEVPLRAGTYHVKIISNEVFNKTNEEVYTFTIIPKSTQLSIVSNDVEFGSDPVLVGDLYEGDYIYDAIFVYEDLSQSVTQVDLFSVVIKDQQGLDVTSSYDLSFQTHEINIIARQITIKPLDVTKSYDGYLLTTSEVEVISGTLLEGHEMVFTSTGEITNVGSVISSINDIHIYDGDVDVTSNYAITLETGTLEISAQEIKVESASASKVYDGTTLSAPSFEVIEGYISNLETATILTYQEMIDVSVETNDITIMIKNQNQEDVTSNYLITYVYGTLEVTQRAISVQTASDQKDYDSTELSNTNLTLLEGSLADGDHISVTEFSSIIETGVIDNILSIKIYNQEQVDVTDNYLITYSYGQLEIISYVFVIKPTDVSKVYDGTPLTNQEVEVVFGSLPSGYHIEIETIGSQINAGISQNEIIAAKIYHDIEDVTSSYDIRFEVGLLEVTKRAIVIQPSYATKTYDGFALTSNEGETISPLGLILDHVIILETQGSQTFVGMSSNLIMSAHIFNGDVDETDNYEIAYQEGLLEVTPRPITIESVSDFHIYDGQNFTNSDYQIISGSLVEGDYINVIHQESIINVGSILNVIEVSILNQNIIDQSDQYDITILYGTLEVTPRPILIETASDSKTYDGTPLFNATYQIVTGTLLYGHQESIISYTSITNTGSVSNELGIQIFNEQNQDVTYNYDISFVHGTLEVTAKSIVIATANQTKIYDGIALYNQNFAIVSGSLYQGETMQVLSYTEQINSGSSDNVLDIQILDQDLNDISNNYQITYVYGTLTVTPRPITFETLSDTKTYDGIALSNQNFNIISGSLIGQDQGIVLTYNEILHVGVIQNDLMISIVNGSLEDVTYNYQITYLYGQLEVTPKEITVVTASDSKIYDGTPLYNTTYDVIGDEFIAGDILYVLTYSEIIHVGMIDNVFTYQVLDSNDNDISNDYIITFEAGTLEITPAPLTIETASDIKIYDGLMFFNKDYQILTGNILLDHHLEVSSYTSMMNVGVLSNQLALNVIDSNQQNVSYNYEITYQYGTLEITPRPLVILTASDQKAYDGTPLYNIGFDVIEGSLVGSDQINVSNFTSITNYGSVDNVITFIILNSTNQNVSTNYLISYQYGTLEIYSTDLTIKPADATQMYDGSLLESNQAEIVSGVLPDGVTIVITTTQSITDVSSVTNEILTATLYKDGQDITDSFNIYFETGTLEVTPRTITVQPVFASKVYDGTALTSDLVKVTGETGLVLNHVMIPTTFGSQTDIGESDNVITHLVILENDIDVTSNYDVTYLVGTLRVSMRSISIETQSETKVYDGLPLTNDLYQITEGSLLDGDVLVLIDDSSITEVGFIDNVLTFIILNSQNEDVTSLYDIGYTYGMLQIQSITIKVTTANDIKVYDGTPLTNSNWTLTSGNVLDGHELIITVTGTITEVGRVFNTFDYVIMDQNSLNVTSNYTVIKNVGTLEIVSDKQVITIETDSDTKIYDGTPLTNLNWTIIEGELWANHTLEVTVTGTITEVGSINNTFDYVIYDENLNDVTSLYYQVNQILGQLTILDETSNGNNQATDSPISSEGTLEQPTSSGALFKVYSEISDMIYLRDKSYGDYNYSGWESPLLYESPYGVTPLAFPGLAAQNVLTSTMIQIEASTQGLSYYIPYYSINGFYDNTNDVYATYVYGEGYSIDYLPITSLNYRQFDLSDTVYSAYELAYRSFVYDTYLQIPQDTKQALLQIASNNGLSSDSQTMIEDVQNYIQNAAIYNLAFQPIPDGVDYAVYFLTESREGICQHFAMAATLMYRALGLPARYVTGFAVQGIENTWVDVTVMQAHAWTEVYIDGLGWIPVEVTAGGAEGTSNNNGGTPVDNQTTDKPVIEITSENDSKTYDGTPLINQNYTYTGTLLEGHTLVVDMYSSITAVGETENAFNVTVIDDFGNDVSDSYDIRTTYGLLVVTPNNDKTNIEIQLFDIVVSYTGQTYTMGSNDYWIPSSNLPTGYSIDFDIIGEITNAGKIITSIDRSTIRIFDELLNDVTNQYNIIFYDGSIEVLQRNLTISLITVEKYYDGLPLTSDVFYISQGSLITGDEVTITVSGTITDVGMTSNNITSVIILNSNGVDVTKNYHITTISGSLIVLSES